MKKINIFIMSFAAVLLGLLQTACTDNPNDWSVDSSVTRQYPPTSFTAEIDSFSLQHTFKIGTLKSAAYYEIQASQTQLLGGGTEETEGITTYKAYVDEDSINRLELTAGEAINYKESEKYYFRVRAIGLDGSKSVWYTNGMLYKDGYVADEALAQTLKANACYSVAAPTGLWSSTVEETSIQLNWYMLPSSSSKKAKCYCAAPSYIMNETNNTRYDLTADDIANYNHVCDGLETGKSYTFGLYDTNGLKIGACTTSTEFAPNMAYAYQCVIGADDVEGAIHKADFTAAATPFTMTVTNSAFGSEPVTFTFNNESAGGWGSGRNDYVSTPDNKALYFSMRGQLKKNCTVTINVPADGRLYFYGYTAGDFTVTQGEGDSKVSTTVAVTATKQSLPTVDDPTVNKSAYLSPKVRLTKGQATLQVGATSLYFYGLCFVPDDPNTK